MRFYTTFLYLVISLSAFAQKKVEKNYPKLSLGANFLLPTGRASVNNTWGYGASVKLKQKLKNNFSILLSGSYGEILGDAYNFTDDTGNYKFRRKSILPLTWLAGTEYQINKLFFLGAGGGYGVNRAFSRFGTERRSSFAYSGIIGIIMPKTNNKFAFDASWNSLPAINTGYGKLNLSYQF